MHFQVKTQENVRKNIFRDKETINKVSLIFSDVKLLTKK